MENEDIFYIFIIKNNKGKFISNLTNPRHKYFDKLQESTKFQEEICSQWLECENDEIDYYRKQFGDNLTS